VLKILGVLQSCDERAIFAEPLPNSTLGCPEPLFRETRTQCSRWEKQKAHQKALRVNDAKQGLTYSSQFERPQNFCYSICTRVSQTAVPKLQPSCTEKGILAPREMLVVLSWPLMKTLS
jgi:hypothetical protein